MKEEFLTYKRFLDQNDANGLAEILDENRIQYIFEEVLLTLDVALSGDDLLKEYHIKLNPSSFEVVDKLLIQKADATIENYPDDYYLLEFSDEELMDVLMKPDEWNPTDFELSKQILKKRGKEINEELIDQMKTKRIDELSKPEKSQKRWIIAGYLFILLGGVFGLFIGWHLYTYKKILPNGKTVYGYIPSDRKNGLIILVLGIISSVLWLLNVVFIPYLY